MRLLLALLSVPVLLAGCFGNSAPASPTPQPVLTPETVPTPSPAPSLVPQEFRIPRVASPIGPTVLYRTDPINETYVAFDLGSDRQLWTVSPGFPPIRSMAVAGRFLAVATSEDVTLYEADGRRVVEVLTLSEVDQENVAYMAASPDGDLLALSVSRLLLRPTPTPLPIGVAGPGRLPDDIVIIYDITQRREVLRFDLHQPEFDDFNAFFGPPQWRDDGAGVYLWGATNSGRPGNAATLYLDGRVVRHDLETYAYVAPNSHLIAEGFASLGCQFTSGHDVVLRDLDSGGILGEMHDQARAFTGLDWSPDSVEFLVESRPYEASFQCEDRWWTAEPELLLMDSETGEVSVVTDLEALMRRWYGDDLVWGDCGGEFVPLRPTPFGNIRLWNCSEPGTLYVGDQMIGFGQFFWFLGTIE